jgi:RNA recognition motif-containing protein
VTEKGTGKSRGFGYVTFANKQDAEEAIKAIDGLVSCVTFEILSEMFTVL